MAAAGSVVCRSGGMQGEWYAESGRVGCWEGEMLGYREGGMQGGWIAGKVRCWEDEMLGYRKGGMLSLLCLANLKWTKLYR